MLSLRRLVSSVSRRLASSRREARSFVPRGFQPRLEILECRRLPATLNWINPQGGDWGVAANWDLNRLPTASDDVVINAGNNITITHSSGTDMVNSLNDQQDLSVTGGSLTVAHNFTQGANHTLTAQGAAFTANGPATIDHTNLYALAGGTVSLPGATSYDGTGSATLYLQARDPNSRLELSHVTTFQGAGSSSAGDSVRVEAYGGATVDLSEVARINSGNAGFLAEGASSQITLTRLTSFVGAAPSVNYLQMVSGGAFHLSPAITTVSQNVAVIFSTAGTVVGALQLDPGSRLTTGVNGVTEGTVNELINNSMVQMLNAGDTLTVRAIYSQNGSLSGPGNLIVNTLLWDGGTMSGTGVTGVTNFLSLRASSDEVLDGRALNLAGRGVWYQTGNLIVGNGAELNVLSGATLDVQNDQAIRNTLGGTAMVSNAGTLLKSAETGATSIQVPFTNSGTLQVTTGTLSLTGGFSNFDGSALTGGTYLVGGIFQFTGANIATNAANITLDGPGASIVDDQGNDALVNLAASTGSLTIMDGRDFTASSDFANAGALTVGDGDSFTSAGTISNSGTITLGNGSGLNAAGDYIQNDGAIVLNESSLTVGGTVNLDGGTLSGSGTINGPVVNAAEIDVGTSTAAGTLTINGDYSQPGGVLMIKIGGLNAGIDYDQLNITGNAAFAGGTLSVELINGFVPDASNPDMFQIIAFGSHDAADDFAVYSGTDLGNGLTLQPQYSDTGLTLVANQA